MKRIGIIAHGLNDGGAERVATIIANYLSNQGYGITFYAVYSEKKEYYISDKIRVVFIKTKRKSGFSRLCDRNIKIWKDVRTNHIDEIISFIPNEALLSQLKGVPTIHTLRNDPSRKDNSFFAAKLRYFSFRLAKRIVFQTSGAKEFFDEKIQSKGIIIPNPIRVKDLPEWDEYQHENKFVTFCRLNSQKNLPMLILAFCKFHKSNPLYSLEIYGDGKLRDELEDLIIDKQASDFIKLCGHTKETYTIMAHSAAFVLSSDFEGLSNSMLEALCIGIPCICTDCPPGGAGEYIEVGKTGLLTPVNDPDAMCDKMNELIENYKIFSMKGKNRFIRKELNVDNICREWMKLL